VWQALLHIPYGVCTTYGTLASTGKAQAVRAVGTAVGRNPLGIIVPCHRVLGADGSLTGYAGGLGRKAALLTLESGARRGRLHPDLHDFHDAPGLESWPLAAIWGSSFLFMRIGGVEFGSSPRLACAWDRRTRAAAPAVAAGQWPALRATRPVLFVGLLNSAHAVRAVAYAVTVDHHRPVRHPQRHGAAVRRAGRLGLAQGPPGPARAAGPGDRLLGGPAGLAKDSASFKPGGSGWAVLACLLATLCYGYCRQLHQASYLGGVPSLATATGSQIGATLGLALPTIWFWPAQMPGAGAWLALLVLGVLCTGIAYILYFRLIDPRLGPARAITVTFWCRCSPSSTAPCCWANTHAVDDRLRAGGRAGHGAGLGRSPQSRVDATRARRLAPKVASRRAR
jgi:O-6-methylguanine DNA methyltransferase